MADGSTANVAALFDRLDHVNEQQDWQLVKDLAEQILELDSNNADARSELRSASRRIHKSQTTPAPEAVPLRDAFVGGRYQVKQLLGEGARKKVYLAEDTTLRREVAFALIKTEGLDTDARTRVMREAQTVGKLGASPNIVSVHDLGENEGAP